MAMDAFEEELTPEAMEFLNAAKESTACMSKVHADMKARGKSVPKTDDVVREIRKEIASEASGKR